MSRKSFTAVTATLGLSVATCGFADIGLRDADTRSNATSVTTADPGGCETPRTLTVRVSGASRAIHHEVADTVLKALRDAPCVVAHEDDGTARDLTLVVTLAQLPWTWSPVYAAGTLSASYVVTGELTMDGTVEVEDRTRGLFSLPSWHRYLARQVALQVAKPVLNATRASP